MSHDGINNGSPDDDPNPDFSDDCCDDLETRSDSTLGISLASKQDLICDLVAAVRDRALKGVLITGRPGVGKSFLVRKFLGDADGYVNCTGMLSRPQAVELFERNPDRLFVFDDVSGCPSDAVFQQMLLHALGNGANDERVVSYNVKGKSKKFLFTGSVLFIGNSAFRGAPAAVIDALESRVQSVAFDPTGEELEWQLYRIAEAGIDGFSKADSVRLTSFVLRECRQIPRDPDIRLLVEKVAPVVREAIKKKYKCPWDELVRQLVRQPREPLRRPYSQDELRQILLDVHAMFSNATARWQEYERRTGRSRATYYRDVGELLGAGDQGGA